jgi:uncharacterized phage-associated protein
MSNAQLELTPLLVDSLYTEAMLLADEARACFDRSFDAWHHAPPPGSTGSAVTRD